MHQFLLTLGGAVNNISKNKTLSKLYMIHINIHAHILHTTYYCTVHFSPVEYTPYIYMHIYTHSVVYGPYPREIETHYK